MRTPSILILGCLALLPVRAQQTNTPYAAEINWALVGSAQQSTTQDPGAPERAIDGNTDGNWASNSTTHSGGPALEGDPADPFWEVDLGAEKNIGAIHVWFRTDCCDNRNDDFSLVVYNAAGSEVWRRQHPGRPGRDERGGLHVLDNIAPAVRGQRVRFVPQNPPTTSDGFFSLAEVQVLAPYQNVTVDITRQPVAVTVTEGREARFPAVAATVVGAPQDRLTYQWLRNGVEIPGATAPTYNTRYLSLADDGAEFTVRCAVSGVATVSAKARLTVTRDTEPPVLDGLAVGGGPVPTVVFTFNELLDPASATRIANYDFGTGKTVSDAVLSPVLTAADGHLYQTVTVRVAGLVQNAPYSVTLDGIKDLAGNAIVRTSRDGTAPFYEINWAMGGTATQSSTAPGGEARRAIDGNTSGFFDDGSVTLNAAAEDPGWWEVDLGAAKPIGRLKIWFRTLTAAECQALFNACAVRNDDFTIQILGGDRQVLWRSTYPGRPPLQVAYNLPTVLDGRYVRFESQSPLVTSDGFFSLAEVQAIAPYANVVLTLAKDLAEAAEVVENGRLLLGPVTANLTGAAGAPADVVGYQWQENGQDIPGANGASYQSPVLSLAKSGVRYRCRLTISGQTVTSRETVVTVTRDSVPPTLKSVVGSPSYTEATVVFSEAVTAATAGDRANYTFSGGLAISEVTVLTPNSVRLTTTVQTPGTAYTLSVRGIRDLASGGGNAMAANTQITFRAPPSDANRYVVVGQPGNPKDTQWNTARGAVGYTYEISRFKVTNAEYAAFLNAKAKSDPNSLWGGGGEILRDGEDGSYSYTVAPGRENRPVRWVATVDAMRMANWLSNGATEDADTETGTYVFSGYDVVGARQPNADYFLPSDDEWYKAAYYDPTKGGSGGYWQFPPKTDDPAKLVAELPPGGAFSANFDSVNAAEGGTTDVGAYSAATSHYGTYDQAGGTWEWNEPQDPAAKTASRRGGSWANAVARLSANVIANNGIGNGGQSEHQSFRLARAHRVRIQWVSVGNPGNPPDAQWNAGRGSVAAAYRISKFKVSNAQYAAFLNAKAKSDPNSLWGGGTEILREGEDGNYSYSVVEGRENRPVRWVAAVDAMRMANWLSNGGTPASDTETGSYTFSGYDVVSRRNPGASVVLPSDDEWFKAAYYDPTKNGTGGYWQFPVKTDDPSKLVSQLPPGGPFSANFDSVNAAEGGTTDVGAYTAASSYYGTFDQAGNTWEWNEPQDPATKTASRRSGSWANAVARLSANVIANNPIGNGGQSEHQSFRLALVVPASPAPELVVEKLTATTVRISWTGLGTLESSATVNGGWTAVPGAASPHLVNPTAPVRFYRVRQ